MTTFAVTGACAFYWKVWDMKLMSCWGKGEIPRQGGKFCTEVGVLLLDMRMPRYHWIGTLLHEIVRQKASTPGGGLSLTGHGDVPMAVEQMKRGAVDFCKLPCQPCRFRRH